MTDETDQGYLDRVVAALDSLGGELGSWGSVRHIDPVIAEHLSDEDRRDNYLVYAVASHLKSKGQNVFEIEKCQYTPSSCSASAPSFSDRRDYIQIIHLCICICICIRIRIRICIRICIHIYNHPQP